MEIFRSFNFDSMLSNQENFITYCHTRLNLIFAFGEFLHVFFIIVIAAAAAPICSDSTSAAATSANKQRASIAYYTFALDTHIFTGKTAVSSTKSFGTAVGFRKSFQQRSAYSMSAIFLIYMHTRTHLVV